MARSHGIVYDLSQVHYIVMKTTRKSLTEKIKAVALATGLSVLPAKEVNSGISYGGSVGVDFNGNVSIGGQILSVNNPNSVYGKLGVNWVVMGKDKNSPSIRGGVGYFFDKGFSLGVEGGYNPKSESPFSLGIGGGYGVVKDEKNGGGENGEDENKFIGSCRLCCMKTGWSVLAFSVCVLRFVGYRIRLGFSAP